MGSEMCIRDRASRRGEHEKGCPHHRQAPSLGESSSRKAGLTGAVIMLFAAAARLNDSAEPGAGPRSGPLCADGASMRSRPAC